MYKFEGFRDIARISRSGVLTICVRGKIKKNIPTITVFILIDAAPQIPVVAALK